MARLNLLQSRYVGALGQTVGTTYKGRAVVRERIDGKSPPSVLQVSSLTAFGRLNRLAGAISKTFWPYCGLSDRFLLKHNVIASMFSPAIANHSFNPVLLTVPFPSLPFFQLQQFVKSGAGDQYKIRFSHTVPVPDQADYKIFIAIFNSEMLLFHTAVYDLLQGLFTVQAFWYGVLPIYCFVLIAKKSANKFSLYSSYIREAKGMQYSLAEQMTDDTWLDTKPIYRRTIIYRVPSTGLPAGDDTLEAAPYMDTLIKYEFFCDNRPSAGNSVIPSHHTRFASSDFNTGILIRAWLNFQSKTLIISKAVGSTVPSSASANAIFYFTFYYTKV